MSRFVYVVPGGRFGPLEDSRLEATTERHPIMLPRPETLMTGDPIAAMRDGAAGVVLEMESGCPTSGQRALLRRALEQRRRAWLWWPEEAAVECVTHERLVSYGRHAALIAAHRLLYAPLARLLALVRRTRWVLRDVPKRSLPLWALKRVARTGPALRLRRQLGDPRLAPAPQMTDATGQSPALRHSQRLAAIRAARQKAKAAPFPAFPLPPSREHRIGGLGLYLRTDFWNPIVSGGSYGHTCYVAKELAAVSESFVCYLANHFPLLDELGVRQVVMPRFAERSDEDNIAQATPFYVAQLRPVFAATRPAYIYERLCIGNYAGALLSAEFGVPYILEYNGSEISMRRSFEGTGYVYEAEYLEAELFAFEQATLISVVSAEIRNGLIGRGVDPAKIIVNPNGVDLAAYAPADAAARKATRDSLGFSAGDRVVGFTGTFGGWHGIDVLGDAIPRICHASPRAKFLLIGDGHFKGIVDRAVAEHGLSERVISTGRVTQADGARLLQACDIYVSPHSTHMVDSKFFGSPTKIFEYMALGGGIVASDLEQIGQVLSPAFTPQEASLGPAVADQRAVLCPPGDVDAFVLGVTALVEHPELAAGLGCNARRAARDHYSWTRHVSKLWQFLAGPGAADLSPDLCHKSKPRAADPARTPAPTRSLSFEPHVGEEVLEIGGGIGGDLAQFASRGARVTHVGRSADELARARERFAACGLEARFLLDDGDSLAFADATFDLVYSSGVLQHAPDAERIVDEIRRVMKPGGRAIITMYAENSLYYWRDLVWTIGIKVGQLRRYSMGEILSRTVARPGGASARLVKVYSRERVLELFDGFAGVAISQCDLGDHRGSRLASRALDSLFGWHLVVTAEKPRTVMSR
jgi:glycosyltransferase involved in cell wall biosynthesis